MYRFKFSIIIPTFNRSRSLKVCLDSLVSQEYKNFEVIVCDDGSTDNTKDVISQYNNHLTLKYQWRANWGGPARPRNLGIGLAEGEWICFLDSDDSWLPNKLRLCAELTDQCDFIFHNMKMMRSDKEIGTFKGRKFSGSVFRDLLIRHNPISNSSVLIRKSIIDKVGLLSEERELIAVEDFDYWLRIAIVTNRFHYINKTLGIYNYGFDNITTNGSKQISRIEYIYKKYIQLLSKKDQKQAMLAMYYMLGVIQKASGNYQDARRMFLKATFAQDMFIRLKSFYQLLLTLFNK